ncbi:MAG: hypothetical protein JWQ87_3272 [Candidatus Sulfotelmatobacter sp.]|nr:hypothetical protein [Candidatus Sulfotelmatobacter sp.]
MSSAANGRTLAEVMSDAKEELTQFVQTRFELLKTELEQKFKLLKVAGLLAAVAAVLIATAYLFLTVALAAFVAATFADSPYRWVFGFLAVGVLWGLLGGIAGYFAKREFALKGIAPSRTIAVLKGDKLWIQSEAKNPL